MAYCLRSFVQILDEVLHPEQHHKKWVLDHAMIPHVQSLWETASFLRDFLDNSSPLVQYRISNLEDKIMDAAKKAEDTLETYLTSQLISNPEGLAFTISPPNLGEATQAFDDAKREAIKFLDTCQRSDNRKPRPVLSTRYPNHKVVVGVTEDLNQLRSRLTSRAPELDIIPIVGMGGMGKTTLARILYDQFSSTSKSNFDCCAWVTVSQTYDPQQILKTLLDCLPEKTQQHDKQHGHELVVRLHKTLYGRRYLIVLDDIWSSKAWDDMQRAFPRENNGSRIILTTREKTVVDYVNPKCHEMHLINKDESWELLRGKIFGEELCPRVLEEVGKSIATSCGGLPLALQVIGGLLSQSHKTIDFWKHVGNNVRSLIAKTDDQFSGIFDWSFNHLPHYLKPCFLYIAGFPEDEEIRGSQIIKLWVAEGFLYPIRDRSLEEAARIHLNALVDRNLIFVHQRGKSGRVKIFGIHDILRDLCLRKAEEKKFLYFNDIQIDNIQKDVLCLGHVVSGTKFKPLSSFRSYNYVEELPCLCFKLSLLQVLDFGPHKYFDKFPGMILQLVNLRYLRIKSEECTPKSIYVLRYLQTLIVSEISSLAVIVSDMPQLRRLEFWKMKEHSELEYGVHENLQSLAHVPPQEVKKLHGKLPNLRKLMISGYTKGEEFIDLTSFHNLKTLYRRSDYYCGYDYTYTRGMTLTVSLQKLTLYSCEISQSVLDAVGALPNLQILIIEYSFPKMDWEPCEDGFRELKYLKLHGWDLENWLATEVHFPVLEHLVLKKCFHLVEIPYDFGAIENLKIIEVYRCLQSVDESARRIYEEQREFGNTDLQLRLGIDTDERTDQCWLIVSPRGDLWNGL